MKLHWLAATVAAILLAGLSSANSQTLNPLAPGTMISQQVVIDGGQIIGRDPDPLVRLQLKRDYKASGGGD